MNWLTHLLDELLAYSIDAQEKGNPFNYSWFLIFISFVAWAYLPNYQGIDVPLPFEEKNIKIYGIPRKIYNDKGITTLNFIYRVWC